MASNPPFQMEDTDEDFFDKLVDDDDDYKVTPSSSGEVTDLGDGNDSDQARAFSNLSVSDVGAELKGSQNLGVEEEQKEEKEEEATKDSSLINGDFKDESTDNHVDPGRSLVSSNSFAFDSVVEESNDGAIGMDTASGNHGDAGASGVKEVQWSAFSADPLENGSNGFGSYPDFFNEIGDNLAVSSEPKDVSGSVIDNSLPSENDIDYSHQFQEGQSYATAAEQSTQGQDLNDSQNWENLYPGWRYDANTGQWYQVNEGYDVTGNVQGAHTLDSASDWTVSNEKTEVSYLQQTTQSFVGAVPMEGTTSSVTSWDPVSQASQNTESLSYWNQASQNNNGYPSHMVFDPQYPGWYYDMNAQEWRSLDAYNSQPTVQAQDHANQNGFSATSTYYGNDQKIQGGQGQFGKQSESEVFSGQGQDYNWNGSFSNVKQQSSTMWQPDTVSMSAPLSYGGNQQVHNQLGTNYHVDNHVNQQQSFDYGRTTSSVNEFPAVSGTQSFVPSGNFSQSFNHSREQSEMSNAPKAYGSMNQTSYSQQTVQSGQQISYVSTAGRSSAGRPPHALITFGFGGKLIVMKDTTALINSSYGSQDSHTGSISILNLAEVATGSGAGACGYFHTLCRQSFPGPLAGGNVGSRELNKWIDERITHSESSEMDYKKGEVLRLLLSLLKIASQHYGKLRSPFGTDTTSKENVAPEVAVARLFASVRKNSIQGRDYGVFAHCLQQLPSEGQTQATAAEVQTLLVSGRKIEALHCAQEGQLWGPALVLAAQLGDQFYVDTVKKMALRQLVAGSPLRTLCLLIAGQPADVFSTDTTADGGAVNTFQQPAQAQLGASSMLDDWEENLAVITANRTKDDELVLIHLGDCLWKETSNIIAAHICYLVAEANFEPYSDSARMCLIGSDHWKHPRTYASPEAIQRTEVYEYSKLLGNSQFTLLPFQPYKLIYAHMLAEVGRVSDSLKYCQAISKSLKTGRAPEVETWRQLVSSLEERIKAHQQGGFSTNLAPGKLVGKLLNLFDSTAHRVVGGLPPPVPSTSGGGAHNDHHHQPTGPRVSTSQSTMAMSSLMPSGSMEPINQWSGEGNTRRIMHNRSVSEPDFGRSPRQGDPLKENSSDSQSKASGSISRFGRFGFGSNLLQKTVGLVLKPRQDKQAKLGDTNKFYYDEKLKRWVEEGVDPPAEEAALAPPPTLAAFQNGTTSDYNLKSALKSEGSSGNGSPEFTSPTSSGRNSGIPPIPATSNQFSARGRTGVRARYVDTFNQGGGNPTTLFQSPSAPSIKPNANSNPRFFVPAATPASEQPPEASPHHHQHQITENPSFSPVHNSFESPSRPSSEMQRYPSMNDLSKGTMPTFANSPVSPRSRRTASWSGSFNEGFPNSNRTTELKPLGEVLGMPPSSFLPSEPPSARSSTNGGSFSDDLQEVEF